MIKRLQLSFRSITYSGGFAIQKDSSLQFIAGKAPECLLYNAQQVLQSWTKSPSRKSSPRWKRSGGSSSWIQLTKFSKSLRQDCGPSITVAAAGCRIVGVLHDKSDLWTRKGGGGGRVCFWKRNGASIVRSTFQLVLFFLRNAFDDKTIPDVILCF